MIMAGVHFNETKTCALVFLFLLVISTHSQAQLANKGLRLGATVGTCINNFSSTFGSTTVQPNFNSFALGAGANYLSNRLVLGGEFYQLNGNQSSATESIQFIGAVTTVSFGYCLLERKNTRLETSLGLGFSNNQVISQDRQNTRFQNVINNQQLLNPSLSVYQKGANNLCFGLRLIYSVGAGGETNWKYQSSGLDSGFKSNVNAFSVQLLIGGIVEFAKRN
jgi:hypothetical protein